MVTKLGKPWGLMVSTAALVIASLVMLLLTPALAMFPRVSISVTLVMLGYYYIDALLGWRGAINRQGEILDHWKQCQDEMAPLMDELGREARRASASAPEGT